MSMTPPTAAPAAPAAPAPVETPANEFKAPATQEEMDRIIESRLARERDKYKDYDELKAAKTTFDEHTESQKTAAQKAIDAAKGEGTTETTHRFLSKLVNSEVRSLAVSLGFNDPADALQVIDATKLPVKDDEADADAIKALVEKLAADKPYLVKADGTRKPRTRPTPQKGEPADDNGAPGKGRAAAALRQLGAARRND